jgi:hypothetical protein
MARRTRGIIGLLVVCGLLAGCGMRMFATRDPWRRQAEEECLGQKAVQATAYTEPMPAIDGSGGACGMDFPFRVAAFGNGAVALSSKAVLACPAINTIDHWLADVVQPAAQLYLRTQVTEMKAGSYSCRAVNGQPGGNISEHAFGNAADIFAFRFADGHEVTVERGWRGDPREQEFLREIFLGACQYFSTVLGPGSDAFHYNHFHVDLARRQSGRTVCKPVLKWQARLQVAGAPSGYPPVQHDRTASTVAVERSGGYSARAASGPSAPPLSRDLYKGAPVQAGRGSLQSQEGMADEPMDDDGQAVDTARSIMSGRSDQYPQRSRPQYERQTSEGYRGATAQQSYRDTSRNRRYSSGEDDPRPPGGIGRY